MQEKVLRFGEQGYVVQAVACDSQVDVMGHSLRVRSSKPSPMKIVPKLGVEEVLAQTPFFAKPDISPL